MQIGRECLKTALLVTCLGLELFWHPTSAQAQEPSTTRQELLKQQRIAKHKRFRTSGRVAWKRRRSIFRNRRFSSGWLRVGKDFILCSAD
jgi:hypothetical protein